MWGQLIREEISLKRTLYDGLGQEFRRLDTVPEVELVMLLGISFKDGMTICARMKSLLQNTSRYNSITIELCLLQGKLSMLVSD